MRRVSTDEPNYTKKHRIVIRGYDHRRARPQNQRYVVGSEYDSLTKIKIIEGEWNWLGQTWLGFNNNKYPSLNQIEAGLIAEAMV